MIAFLVVTGVASGMVYVIHGMLDAPPKVKKMVQQISLIQPPPPPPPPKIEKPPEPEIQKEVKLDEPKPVPDDMPPEDMPSTDDLGLDATGGAGGDAFGLLGKKGGHDLIGGNGGSRFAWYANTLQQDISDLLYEYEKLRKEKYSIVVNIWIDKTGRVHNVELVKPSGDKVIDKTLKLALSEIHQLNEKPPEDLPQPIKLKITSRL